MNSETRDLLIKIINRSATSNRNESESALRKAEQLIRENNVTIAEVKALRKFCYAEKMLDILLGLLADTTKRYGTKITKYPTHCQECGKELISAWGESERSKQGTGYGRPKNYCSNACKMKNYRQRKKQNS